MARCSRITRAVMVMAILLCLGCSGSAVTSTQMSGRVASPQTDGLTYYLPKRVLELHVWERTLYKEIPVTVKGRAALEYEPTGTARYAIVMADMLIPDRNYMMRLTYHPEPSFSDHVYVSMTSDGLLTEVSTTTKDESSTIVAKLAELARVVATAGVPLTKSRTGLKRPDRLLAIVVVDPTDAASCQAELGRFGITLVAQPALQGTDAACALEPQPPCTPVCQQAGVCYRPVIPYKVTITPGGALMGPTTNPVPQMIEGGASHMVMLPNRSPVVCYPMNRRPFVESYTHMTFDRGLLATMRSDKPSEIVGFLSIPIDIAKAIVSIPAELFQVRVTHMENAGRRDKAEREALDELNKLNAAKDG